MFVVLYYEDDPSKNTAIKMIKMGLAKPLRRGEITGMPIVLNPFSDTYLGPWHGEYASRYGIIVIDASWRKLGPGRFKGIRGLHVKLPPLLPGNPVNYGKPCILSSVEAVAAALYIMGFRDEYNKLINLYKWMKTFNDLNKNLLEDYSKARNQEDVFKTIYEYWNTENPCHVDQGGRDITRVL